MTIRAVVTVALAAGILAASMPAVERARVSHADARVAGEVGRLERVADALAASSDVVPAGQPPARERFTLHLPVGSWGTVGIDRFRVPPPSHGVDVSWRVRGGARHARQLSAVRIAGPPGGLHLDDGGRHRIVLELRVRQSRRTIVVRRAGPTT